MAESESESDRDSDPSPVYPTRKETEVKLPRPTRVNNKTPASIIEFNYRFILLRKRKGSEDRIRRSIKSNQNAYVKDSKWEESQKDFNQDRIDQLRYKEKLIRMDEMLRNVAGARQIFERWMRREPDQQAWLSYIEFELRYNEIKRARGIFERFVKSHPKVGYWIRFAQFERKNGEIGRARNCYERAVDLLADDEEAEQLFVAFAEFEVKCKETERARCIYEFAIDHVPKGWAEDLYRKFVAFQKLYGDREEGIEEDAIVGKRRLQYEEEVIKNPLNYDYWFDYIQLEERVGSKERIREIYKRTISNVPPAAEKSYWQRYIYLWINYALYEELDAQDMERIRYVYSECLKLIPHEKFSFAKIWLLAAQFEIRQLNLKGACLILGIAIERAPKDKIFKKCIENALQLGNTDRWLELYKKYLKWSPENCYAWSKFAEFERTLRKTERAKDIFELAIAQPALDMPEFLWKAYIDFEISNGEFKRARQLYERLLNCMKHLKVWISYAKFEASTMEDDYQGPDLPENDVQESLRGKKKQCLLRARRVFSSAENYFRTSAPELKEDRAMLLEEWLNLESSFGELGDVSLVRVKLPKKFKKRG